MIFGFLGYIYRPYIYIYMQSKVCKKNGEVLLTVKAYNSRCVTEWLAAELLEVCRSEHMRRVDARLPAMSVCVWFGFPLIMYICLIHVMHIYSYLDQSSIILVHCIEKWQLQQLGKSCFHRSLYIYIYINIIWHSTIFVPIYLWSSQGLPLQGGSGLLKGILGFWFQDSIISVFWALLHVYPGSQRPL